MDEDLEYTSLEKIVLLPRPGATVFHAERELLRVCVEQWCTVEMTHNDRLYRAEPGKLCDTLQRPAPAGREGELSDG